MRITESKLRKVIRGVIREFQTTSAGLAGTKLRKGQKSDKTKYADTALKKHKSDEPSKTTTSTKTTTDKTSWTHPYSKVTAKLGKGETLPSHTWQDTSKTGKTTYGQGGEKDYAGKPASGYTRSKAAPGTHPTTTSYSTQYGQGSESEYTTAQSGAGRDQWLSAPTTNPTNQVTKQVTNPSYTNWAAVNQRLQKVKSDAQTKPDTALKFSAPTYSGPTDTGTGGSAETFPHGETDSDEYADWKDTQQDYEREVGIHKADFEKFQKIDRSKVVSTVGTKGKGKGKGKKGEDDDYEVVKKESILKDIKKLISETDKIHKNINKKMIGRR